MYAQGITIGGITVDPSHGLQRVSDTGNVTTTTLQFDNATTGFTTTANATIGRDLTVTGNATVSSNLTVTGNAVISDDLTVTENLLVSNNLTVTGNTFYTNPAAVLVDSNVVTEYTGPHDRPLRKYPEVAMTSASQDGYVVTASSEYTTGNKLGVFTYYAWKLFDEISGGFVSGETWINGSFSAYDSNGDYVLSPANNLGTGADDGEWVKLELPVKIRLERIRLISRDESRAPKEIKIYGSNDNVNWVEILSDTNSGEVQTFGIPYTDSVYIGAYKYLGLVIKKVIGTGGYFAIDDLEYYGREEGSGSLDTTLKSVYNVPATTGTQLEVYYDAKDFSGTPSSITDKSGNNITATANNITIDTTYNSFEITSSPRSNIIVDNVTFVSGDEAHTYALWVRLKNSKDRNLLIDYRPDGGTSTTGNAAGVFILNSNKRIQFYHQGADIQLDYNFVTDTWYHIICSYSGGGNNTTNSKIYINGTEQTNSVVSGSTSVLSLPATGKLTIGDYLYGDIYGMGDGNIGNVRLYSKALNADQVKELYDYQKDYFLGSKSQVTLYKGHLGVGVTEPSGQLELAGDERLQEYPPGPMSDYETYIPGHGVFCVYAGETDYASSHNFHAWEAFNDSTDIYHANNASYNGTDYAYSGNVKLAGQSIPGNYMVLELPYKIKVQSVSLGSGGTRSPEDFKIVGSNDGLNWTTIKSFSGQVYSSETNFLLNSTEYFSKLAMIVTKIQNDSTWQYTTHRYFGTPGPTTLDKGSLSLTRSLDVPRISRYDVDTETPRPEKLVLDFDTTVNSSPTDISGHGNHGTFVNGASYSPVDKAFTFDGTTDTIKGEISGISGDYVHSISFWGNFNATNQTVFEMGSRSDNDLIGINYKTGYLQYYFYANDYRYDGATQLYAWNHFVFTYSGGGTSRKVFLNGVELGLTSSNGAAVNQSLTLANGNYSIGDIVGSGSGSGDLNGKISNFKIYSVALEPSEVKKLYNLGRTGRSMVISDTAVGIGKVPEAQLDVRGNIKCDGIVKPYTCAFAAYVSSGSNASTSGIFPAENVHFNIGNCYDTSTYKFTAPVHGIYYMSFSAFTNTGATSSSRIYATINDAVVEQVGATIEQHGNSLSLTVELEAGNTFYFKGGSGVPIYYFGANGHNRFSGHLICAL
ncbi:hypothetical protein OAA41_00445 [bacterium]|nr:hypothetical protein [bacterium]